MLFIDLVRKAGIIALYPIIDEYSMFFTKLSCTVNSLMNGVNDSNIALIKKFIDYSRMNGIINGTKISVPDYLASICTDKMYRFYAYYRHGIDSLRIGKFLSDFCQKPIDEILENFKKCSGKKLITNVLHHYPEIIETLNKIFDAELAVQLYMIFAKYDFYIKLGRQTIIISNSANRGALNDFYRSFYSLEKSNIEEYIKQEPSKSQAVIRDVFTIGKITDKIIKYVIQFGNYYAEVYNFYNSMTITEIKEYINDNPIWDALAGHFLNDSDTKETFLVQFMVYYNVYMNHLIKVIAPKNNSDKSENLIIPKQEIIDKRLIIEI